MIDREKVIKGLECHAEVNCVECPYRDGWRTCPFGETLLADAIDLLKEQEPLEPTRVEVEQAGPLYYRCYCKKCGHRVGNMMNNRVADVHENFCSRCGRAVKWE